MDDNVIIETDSSAPLLPDDKADKEQNEKEGWISCRNILAIMAFLGFVNVYALRVNLSVAMVAMVNSSYIAKTNESDECPHDNGNTTSTTQDGEFPWDTNLQGLILGSFFYGYIVTQVPGGWLAEKLGGKLLYGLGVFCTAAFTLVTPVAAKLDVNLLIAVRVLEGIGEGVTFPAFHAILSKWAPVHERSKLGAFVYAGAQFGTVVSMPLSGLLCEYGFAGGWPSVFYVFGSLGCLWFIAWMFLVYDSPSKHPRISAKEKKYIIDSIGHAPTVKPSVPWKSILTSMPFWACLVAHFCNNWGFYTLLTCLPTYMKTVLNFDLKQNGLLSALPYIGSWLFMTFGGLLADHIRKKGYLSTTNVRKGCNVIGLVGPGIFLICQGFIGCDRMLAVALLVCSIGLTGIAMSGYGVNHLDLAPPFAGTLMGLTNMVATIPGFVGPQVVGILTHDNQSRGQWQIVFYIACGIYVFGAIFYLIFGSGEEQPWSRNMKIQAINLPNDDEDYDDEFSSQAKRNQQKT